MQARDHQRGLTVLHVQRSGHGNLTHRHDHHAVHNVGSGVVEGHAHRRRTGAGEAIAQAEIRSTGRLQRQFLIAADHHRDRGIAHACTHRRARRQRSRRLVGHDEQLVLRRRRSGRLPDSEVARQRNEARHLCLETFEHHGRLSVLDIQGCTDLDAADIDRHGLIQDVGARVVEGDSDRLH